MVRDTSRGRSVFLGHSSWLVSLLLLIAGVITGVLVHKYFSSGATRFTDGDRVATSEQNAPEVESQGENNDHQALPSNVVALDQEQWQASNIQMMNVKSYEFSQSVRLTGKVTLNQDKIAHLYPMVSGAVDEVSVTLGQNVKKDDLMVVIHSREVGQAKLDLYQAKLQQEIALVKKRLQEEIAANAEELLVALRGKEDITSIESRFRNRTMGDYRERLLAAYSSYLKSQADVSRLESVTNSGAISGNQLLTAQANRNADLATFQARIEQIDYEVQTSLLLSSQAVKEAETRIAVASTNLRILGCDEKDIELVDPAQQGESISHYPIRAPFDGTVITKDVVLREQVRPDVMVLGIADLSSVWITADIYEKHIPMLAGLNDQTVSVRNEAWPDRVFHAKVFYTGEIMDEATRTISLTAVADNSEQMLKPGMFVSIEMPSKPKKDVLQVPLTAIQEHQDQKFVFVHVGGDQFERRNVHIGESNTTSAEILTGLQEGETVVSNGGFILKSLMLAELMGEE